MKNLFKTILTLLVFANVAFASWYNPFTWLSKPVNSTVGDTISPMPMFYQSGTTILPRVRNLNFILDRGVTVGNSTSTATGTIRYNSGSFEGYNGSTWGSLGGGSTDALTTSTVFAGDVSGTSSSLVIDKFRGRNVTTTQTPSGGYIFKWSALNNEWYYAPDDTGAGGGITSINSQTGSSQTITSSTYSGGTYFYWGSSADTHTLYVPTNPIFTGVSTTYATTTVLRANGTTTLNGNQMPTTTCAIGDVFVGYASGVLQCRATSTLGLQSTLTTGNLTAGTGLAFDNTRTVIGGAAQVSIASGYNLLTDASSTEFASSSNRVIDDASKWNTAYGYAHATATETITGIDLTGQAFSLTSGYIIPTTASTTDWASTSQALNTNDGNWTSAYSQAHATATESITGIDLTGQDFSLTSGYVIPLSASTTNWNNSYNIVNSSSTNWDSAHDKSHDIATENITGIDLTGQLFSLTSGYNIPTDASTTEWANAYGRIYGGTMTDTKYCTYASATGKISCNSEGGAGGITSLAGLTGSIQTISTSSKPSGLDFKVVSSGTDHQFQLTVDANNNVPLTASTSEWATTRNTVNSSSSNWDLAHQRTTGSYTDTKLCTWNATNATIDCTTDTGASSGFTTTTWAGVTSTTFPVNVVTSRSTFGFETSTASSTFYFPSSPTFINTTATNAYFDNPPTVSSTRTYTDDYQLVDVKYVNDSVATIGTRFYMLDAADASIATYKQTTTTASSLSTANVSTSSNASTDTLIEEWVSPAGFNWTVLQGGIYDLNVYVARTAGSRNVSFYWKFFERRSDSSEIAIATSSVSGTITTKTNISIYATLSSDYIPSAGSRLVGKVYMRTSGGSATTTGVIYYQGDEDSHWQTPVSQEWLDDNYARLSAENTFSATNTFSSITQLWGNTYVVSSTANGLLRITNGLIGTSTIDISGDTNLTASNGIQLNGDNIEPATNYSIPLTASTTDWTSSSNALNTNDGNWTDAYTKRVDTWTYPLQLSSNVASIASNYFLTTSTAFGGDVSGTSSAIVVANDSHTHGITTGGSGTTTIKTNGVLFGYSTTQIGQDDRFTYNTSTDLFTFGNGSTTNFTATNLWGTKLTYTNASTTNITASGNGYFGAIPSAGNVSSTNLTTGNLYATWLSATNGSTTNFTVNTNSYLGTVKSGLWNGTVIGLTYGGTGTTTAPTTDQILVGNSGGTYDYRRIIAGSNITISTSTAGTISIASTASGSGGTTVFVTTTPSLILPTSTLATYDFMLGSTATASAPFWWDVSATTTYIGTTGAGDGAIDFTHNGTQAMTLGYDYSTGKFTFSTSTDFSAGNIMTLNTSTMAIGMGGYMGAITECNYGTSTSATTTIDFASTTKPCFSNYARVEVATTTTVIDITDPPMDGTFTIRIAQGTSTTSTLTYASDIAFEGGFTPSLPYGTSSVSVLSCQYHGTPTSNQTKKFFCQLSKDWK